jgi:pimeloyl-ACP methyl ester carboxylesterase
MKPATRISAGAAAVGMASFTYQRIAEARDRRRFSPPGRLVDSGGRRLHLVTAGGGSPTVVIIPALADNVLGWMRILQGAAAETQACVDDRAEVGWSDPPPHWRRTPHSLAGDLNGLLSAAGIPAPYVLVGHSIGGIIARRFYAEHPGLVAEMLLVDSSHEQQVRRFAVEGWRRGPVRYAREAVRRQARILGMRRLAVALGLVRGFDADIAREVPPEYAAAYRAILLSSPHRHASVREMIMATFAWGQPPGLGSIPLTVLTRADGTGEVGLAGHSCKTSWPGSQPTASTSTRRGPDTIFTSTSQTWSSRRSMTSSGDAGNRRTQPGHGTASCSHLSCTIGPAAASPVAGRPRPGQSRRATGRTRLP